MSNKYLAVAFDVDGTLIQLTGPKEDTPRYEIISMFHFYEKMGCRMFIWIGGGIDYAARWRDKLGLTATVVAKNSFTPDICFDDEEVNMAKVNVRVALGNINF